MGLKQHGLSITVTEGWGQLFVVLCIHAEESMQQDMWGSYFLYTNHVWGYWLKTKYEYQRFCFQQLLVRTDGELQSWERTHPCDSAFLCITGFTKNKSRGLTFMFLSGRLLLWLKVFMHREARQSSCFPVSYYPNLKVFQLLYECSSTCRATPLFASIIWVGNKSLEFQYW